jgi:NAD(P)-dependent dehydrogenase (short-subunit alcohol dehydrogenase family)
MKKIVQVTGTSSGLGKAFATSLLQAGFTVVGTVRKHEAVAEFVSRILDTLLRYSRSDVEFFSCPMLCKSVSNPGPLGVHASFWRVNSPEAARSSAASWASGPK